MNYLKGLDVKPKSVEFELEADLLLKLIKEVIKDKTGVELTPKKHFDLLEDEEVKRFSLYIRDEEFTDDEYEKVSEVFNLEEWYTTFDEVLAILLGVEKSWTGIYHYFDSDAKDKIIIGLEYNKNKEMIKELIQNDSVQKSEQKYISVEITWTDFEDQQVLYIDGYTKDMLKEDNDEPLVLSDHLVTLTYIGDGKISEEFEPRINRKSLDNEPLVVEKIEEAKKLMLKELEKNK